MSINAVAPLAGAWIEILRRRTSAGCLSVAPLAGAWIEMFALFRRVSSVHFVAPLAGAWIEIYIFYFNQLILLCRSPRGSVD